MPELERRTISTPLADAEIYLQGAHITAWTPRGERPVLYMSPRSLFAEGKAIRGGIPVIFPWFGARSDGKPGPMHGYARTSLWTVDHERTLADGRMQVQLSLEPMTLRAIFGATLEVDLVVCNESAEPLAFEDALHTYFAVGDIEQVTLTGLENTTYLDKTESFAVKQQPDAPMRITKETDQVHVDTTSTCVIHDPAWNRRIIIEKSGSDTTVVWNPWSEKSKSMADMDADGWRGMLCVETANAGRNAVTLSPGESHRMGLKVSVEK